MAMIKQGFLNLIMWLTSVCARCYPVFVLLAGPVSMQGASLSHSVHTHKLKHVYGKKRGTLSSRVANLFCWSDIARTETRYQTVTMAFAYELKRSSSPPPTMLPFGTRLLPPSQSAAAVLEVEMQGSCLSSQFLSFTRRTVFLKPHLLSLPSSPVASFPTMHCTLELLDALYKGSQEKREGCRAGETLLRQAGAGGNLTGESQRWKRSVPEDRQSGTPVQTVRFGWQRRAVGERD